MTAGKIYEFGTYRLDPTENLLSNDGEIVPLKPKAFATLVCLVENRGRLVEKSELMESIWKDTYVEESTVSKCIHSIRSALGECSKDAKHIQTVPKHGYRFISAVKVRSGEDGELARVEDNFNSNRRSVSNPEIATTTTDIESLQRLTKRQRPRYVLAIAATLAVVFAVVAAYRSAWVGGTRDSERTVNFAVLPLKPLAPADRDQTLEFAITESLILRIATSRTINVKNLYAVRKFTDIDTDPIQAGRELRVDYVLSPTYQIADGRIRVTAEVVDVRSGLIEQTLRSETATDSTFSAQDAVANDIGGILIAKFGGGKGDFNSTRGTQNERAFTLYHQARYLIDKSTRDDSMKAVALLDEAVDLDPQFAAAWAVKAQAYCQFAHQGGGVPSEIFAKVEPNIDRALALEPDNAIALTVRGIINRDYYWNLPEAYHDLERASQIDPSLALTQRILAGAYYRGGRFKEAFNAQEKAVDLNPTGIVEKWFLADYQIAAGDVDGGIDNLHQIIEMDPTFQPPYFSLWRAYAVRGQTDKAYEYFMANKLAWHDDQSEIDRFRKIYAETGWKGVMAAELALMRSSDQAGKYSTRKVYIAELASQLGQNEVAFHYLEEARQFKVMPFSYLKVDPLLAPFRNDRRYFELLGETLL